MGETNRLKIQINKNKKANSTAPPTITETPANDAYVTDVTDQPPLSGPFVMLVH